MKKTWNNPSIESLELNETYTNGQGNANGKKYIGQDGNGISKSNKAPKPTKPTNPTLPTSPTNPDPTSIDL